MKNESSAISLPTEKANSVRTETLRYERCLFTEGVRQPQSPSVFGFLFESVTDRAAAYHTNLFDLHHSFSFFDSNL